MYTVNNKSKPPTPHKSS